MRYLALFNASTDAMVVAVGWPMVDTRCVLSLPTRFGDQMRIVNRVIAINKASFHTRHELYAPSERLAVSCWDKRVWAV